MTTAVTDLASALKGQVNKHYLAIALTHACIGDGIDTRGAIVEVLVPIGLDYRHIAIMLTNNCGPDPESNHWRKDGDHYINHAGCCGLV